MQVNVEAIIIDTCPIYGVHVVFNQEDKYVFYVYFEKIYSPKDINQSINLVGLMLCFHNSWLSTAGISYKIVGTIGDCCRLRVVPALDHTHFCMQV